MTYDHIVGIFDGYWYEAAAIYRQWAQNQYWVRKGKLFERNDQPQWFRDITYCHRIDTGSYTPTDARVRALDLNGRLTGPMLAQWYHWEDNSTVGGSGAYPPISTAQSGFLDAVITMLSNNIYVTPYVDPFVWDTSLASFASQALPYACKNPDGSVIKWSDTSWAIMDSGTDWWTNYVKQVVKNIVQNYYVPGIYLDQSGGIMAANFDPSHGNPLGFCENQVAQERNHLSEIINEARTVNPEVMFWGESNSEFAIDLLDAKLVHYNLYKNYLPLFPAVYHEYYPGYGRAQMLKDEFAGDPEPEMQAAWMWIMGYQVGRIWSSGIYSNPDNQEIFTYIDKLNILRSDANEYLVMGRMMRPPYIDPDSIPHMVAELDKGGPAVLPGILASMWRSPQGNLGLAMTNITGSAQTVSIKIDLNEYNFQNQTGYQLYDKMTDVLVASSSDRNFEFNLNIDSLDARVFEFSGATCEFPLLSDLDGDCEVNFYDFALLAETWLICTNPSDPNCIDLR
ncbi:MAG: hypothetical protein BWY69_00006 [Planctomycetes bacterium ADurb.Bin401]|nr:MAG: hypothetical protein BWY69_00006 [Planctomycetes bacterium ADurb.Bin401]